VRNSLDSEL
jgi:hypothetical protein